MAYISLNDTVRFRLNARGVNVYYDMFGVLPKEDSDGMCTMQLHQFMMTFGKYMFNSTYVLDGAPHLYFDDHNSVDTLNALDAQIKKKYDSTNRYFGGSDKERSGYRDALLCVRSMIHAMKMKLGR